MFPSGYAAVFGTAILKNVTELLLSFLQQYDLLNIFEMFEESKRIFWLL